MEITLPIPTKTQKAPEPMPVSDVATGTISRFIEANFKHFNAASLLSAAQAYKALIAKGGKMMVTLAGAMSTGELGISLAQMIRAGKVHAITCTGANLEEDVMNLIAHDDYMPLPDYRTLKPKEEKQKILDKGFNRVTDTAIPEERAFGLIYEHLLELWKQADFDGKSYLPHEYLLQVLKSGVLQSDYQIDPKNSWLLAALEKELPIVVPGWEDSSMGNAFAACCLKGECSPSVVKSGTEYMLYLANWYLQNCHGEGIGFFQIGGGIAGDFPICVVPMLTYDAKMKNIPVWQYFCQISDSTTSYGSYSGAVPNEKITWGKLGTDTPSFIIESDASICAPLVFAYVMGQ